MLQRVALRVLPSACAVLFFLFVSGSPVEAAPRWVRATPHGGPIVDLEQAPSAPQVLYAAASSGRVYSSLDGGDRWQVRAAAPPDEVIADLFVDPQDSRTVYARTNSQLLLLRTRDGARTWSAIGSELGYVSGLALDQDRPGALFAAAYLGLYRSLDGGDTWSLVAFEGSSVVAVAADPRDGATLFAVIAAQDPDVDPWTVWKSTDRGVTWAVTSFSYLPGFYRLTPHVFIDPERPGILYVFFTSDDPYSHGPTFRSTDGGASWSELPAAAGIRDLAALPGGLFAATDFGISRSGDLGETWVPPLPLSFNAVGATDDSIGRILASASVPGTLLAAGSAGVWKSGGGGADWRSSNQGILALGVYSFAIAPTGPSTLIARAGGSLYRSSDRGGTWTRIGSDLDGRLPWAISAVDPRKPRTIYGVGSDGLADFLAKSTNGGHDWEKLPVPYTCGGSLCDVSMSPVVLDPRDPDSVILGGSYFFHFGGQGGFLLRSADGFATLDRLSPLANFRGLVVEPGRPDRYHALTCGHFFQSKDAGAHWRQAGRGLPRQFCHDRWVARPLALDPQDPRRIYVGSELTGVFASSDGGATFQPMNRGLETARVPTVLVDPTDSTKIYAGAFGRGVFRWNEERHKWLPLNAGLPAARFEGVVALDPRKPSTLYAATSEGLFRLDLDGSEP